MTTETGQNNPNNLGEPTNHNSYVKLRKLTAKDDEPIEDILHRAVEQMHGLAEKATIQLRLIGVDEIATKSVYSILITHSKAVFQANPFLQKKSVTKPTLVVITTSKIFRQIAEGSYSPVQAYVEGKMYLQGDVALGRQVILHLAGSSAEMYICPQIITESWQPDSDNEFGGTLTLSGEKCTPNGQIRITYNIGSDTFPQIIVADANGSFTTTQRLHCGDIPGMPGVGVIVNAFDLFAQQQLIDTTGNRGKYSTPCNS